MPPEPLPHPHEDPDHLAARASKREFTDRAQNIRQDPRASDLAKAEDIAAAYEQHVTETAAAYQRITDRRRERLAYLESLVPVGPGIPNDASPADKAVLMTAWRSNLTAARDTDRAGRVALLADAEKYDDDLMRRAVLTTVLEIGEMDTLHTWSQVHVDVADYLKEVAALRGALAGRYHDAPWDSQDFRPLRQPPELAVLGELQLAGQAG